MSIYKSELPEVFPYCVNLEINVCRLAIDLLMSDNRKDVSKGSSFALTVDSYGRTWNLWLSKASYDFLQKYPDLKLETRITWNTFKNLESVESRT